MSEAGSPGGLFLGNSSDESLSNEPVEDNEDSGSLTLLSLHTGLLTFIDDEEPGY
jgi:hypothetical protein